MRKLTRIFRHLVAGRWQVARCFPGSAMRRIDQAIRDSERLHNGELRFVVEAGLDWHDLWRGLTPRQRAIELFSQLRIWDTAHNSGVLIYLLLAERDIEIIADRGLHAKVGQVEWESLCRSMEAEFRQGHFEEGVLQGMARISALLARHFPAHGPNPDELPDAPVIL